MANEWDHSVRPSRITGYSVKCAWCRKLCAGSECRLQTAVFVKLRHTKKRNNCAACPIPVECGMSVLWHPGVAGQAIHYPECSRRERLEWQYPNPELATMDLAASC